MWTWTEILKARAGYWQTSSATKYEGWKDSAALHLGSKAMKFGVMAVIAVFFIVTIRLMLVDKWSAQQAWAGIPNGGSLPGIQRLDPQQPAISWDSDGNSDLILMTRPTLQEAFEGKITFVVNQTVDYRNRTASDGSNLGRAFKTVIEPNKNIMQYGLTVLRDVCARPDGAIVTVGDSEDEFLDEISKVPDLKKQWFGTYNCTWPNACIGSQFIKADAIPINARWVPGTTTHIVPDTSNVFHNFRVMWPHVAGSVSPLNETTPHPAEHFLVQRMGAWLDEAGHSIDQNTAMYQLRMLGELAPGSDFLAMDGFHDADDFKLVCYEKFVLACAQCDTMSNKLGENVTTPAILNLRTRVLHFFGVPEPDIPLPPRRLRVAVYGRGDTKRRKIVNMDEVVQHLRSYTNPPFAVTCIDELLASKRYNQSLPEVVSLLTQTDILITVHGANTFAAFLMPLHAAVIEIEGPCGPTTWIDVIVNGLGLKHDRSNPWGEAVASPDAGNTTECKDPYNTPDMTVDLQKLDAAISTIASPTFGDEDRIFRHWHHS